MLTELPGDGPWPHAGLTMAAWLRALQAVSAAVHPQLPPQAAWDRLVADHVMAYAGSSGVMDADKYGPVR